MHEEVDNTSKNKKLFVYLAGSFFNFYSKNSIQK